jgi:hypothetical protein
MKPVREKDITIKDIPDETLVLKYSITSYGTDFDVDGLVRRIEREDIYVPPFQRAYVWKLKQASRFIESLLLGLPVPGIFLSKESNSQRLLVIDGQQRLRSLLYFYRGVFSDTGKEFVLSGLKSQFNGVNYRSLQLEDQRRLNDSIIHATVIRQDEPDDGQSGIYFVFERLNTGGTQLQPQEIRAALYHGEFNRALHLLNQNQHWRSLYGAPSPRKRDEELILRFFALYYNADNYEEPMKEFLNSFMGKNKKLELHSSEELNLVFEQSTSIIAKAFGEKAFKPKKALNAAVFDSVMVGMARRIQYGQIKNETAAYEKYRQLLENQDYISVTERATADRESVRRRLELATQAFENV